MLCQSTSLAMSMRSSSAPSYRRMYCVKLEPPKLRSTFSAATTGPFSATEMRTLPSTAEGVPSTVAFSISHAGQTLDSFLVKNARRMAFSSWMSCRPLRLSMSEQMSPLASSRRA